jgi:hypothetical protein
MITDNYPDMAPVADKVCIPQETVINNVQLAHAYVPFEKMCSTFTPLSGLRNGTIFPPLIEVYRWSRGGMGGMTDE